MKKVLLLLSEGFEVFEASAFIDVIGWNLVDGDHSTELYTCGLRKEIKSTFNQRVVVDFLTDDICVNDFEALAIPGGFEEYDFYKDAFDNQFLDLIQKFKESNKIIASICVAALPIGKSGILKNKNATTYDSVPRRKALKDFGANVLDEPIVLADKIITSWNPSTAIDVALLLLELLTSDENADNIREQMGFGKKMKIVRN